MYDNQGNILFCLLCLEITPPTNYYVYIQQHHWTMLNGEATKPTRNAKKKKGRKEAYPKGEKNVNENYRYVTWKEWGGWGERVSTEKRKAQVAPPPQQGGCEAKLYYRKGEKIT